MNARPRYNVQISPVRDIVLSGTADLPFWQQRLQAENLLPAADDDGKAQLLLIAVDAKFMGMRFRELSIAVSVCQPDGDREPIGVYLTHAFNSSRMFAFVERTFYHTPYYPATIRVETRLPAAFEVRLDERVILSAQMATDSSTETRPRSRGDEECWEGPILLPRTDSQREGKLFFARLSGPANFYAFAARDTLSLAPTSQAPIVQWLAESEFSPQEWAIRETATHARSKSVNRTSLAPSPAGQPG